MDFDKEIVWEILHNVANGSIVAKVQILKAEMQRQLLA
jgi:hypothetical protein